MNDPAPFSPYGKGEFGSQAQWYLTMNRAADGFPPYSTGILSSNVIATLECQRNWSIISLFNMRIHTLTFLSGFIRDAVSGKTSMWATFLELSRLQPSDDKLTL